MSVTQRGSKQGQPGSNSPELTRGSSPATPETAEGIGNAPTATKSEAERLYVELGLARIHQGKRWGLRWPELTENELAAAAGVREQSGLVLESVGGEIPEGYGLAEMH